MGLACWTMGSACRTAIRATGSCCEDRRSDTSYALASVTSCLSCKRCLLPKPPPLGAHDEVADDDDEDADVDMFVLGATTASLRQQRREEYLMQVRLLGASALVVFAWNFWFGG